MRTSIIAQSLLEGFAVIRNLLDAIGKEFSGRATNLRRRAYHYGLPNEIRPRIGSPQHDCPTQRIADTLGRSCNSFQKADQILSKLLQGPLTFAQGGFTMTSDIVGIGGKIGYSLLYPRPTALILRQTMY
ncbi:hypothetical protein D3C84_804910 [compost metagenome]